MSSPVWGRRRSKQAWRSLQRKLRKAPLNTPVTVRTMTMTMTATLSVPEMEGLREGRDYYTIEDEL